MVDIEGSWPPHLNFVFVSKEMKTSVTIVSDTPTLWNAPRMSTYRSRIILNYGRYCYFYPDG